MWAARLFASFGAPAAPSVSPPPSPPLSVLITCPPYIKNGQPLKKPKSSKGELDETDLEFLKKKKEEAAALKALKEKAAGKGGFAKNKGSK